MRISRGRTSYGRDVPASVSGKRLSCALHPRELGCEEFA
jgi:hypothetical protein